MRKAKNNANINEIYTEKFKNKKGITLVALIVTIIILLILAGVSIATLTESGLFEKARQAEQKSENAQIKEETTLGDYENKIGEYVSSNRYYTENFFGSFYLSGYYDSLEHSRNSYFDINVKNYKKIKIQIEDLHSLSSVYACYILVDNEKVQDINTITTYELDVSDNSTVRIHYTENEGFYYVKGNYELYN